MYLNTAVAREISTELARQEMKPKVLTFWLGVSDKKAAALCKGNAVWTMADLEAAAEGLGIDLSEMVTRCATRLKQEHPPLNRAIHVLPQGGGTRSRIKPSPGVIGCLHIVSRGWGGGTDTGHFAASGPLAERAVSGRPGGPV